jgi:Rieske Fe-S protein
MAEPRKQDCDQCGVPGSRREFLREASTLAMGVFVSLGASRREAAALQLARVSGTRLRAGAVSYPMPAADGVSIDTGNEIILARYHGSVYAFDLSCPHQRTMLKWLAEDGLFQCPKHKSKYQPDGTFVSGRATRNMDRHPIKLDGDKLVVDSDGTYESDKDKAGWEAAAVKV